MSRIKLLPILLFEQQEETRLFCLRGFFSSLMLFRTSYQCIPHILSDRVALKTMCQRKKETKPERPGFGFVLPFTLSLRIHTLKQYQREAQ